ncbi:Gamma-aminobutyric acid receptor-associated protein-like 2 [Geodia barretti]|uniref:Gamma-aminobutyric acid receptor-associated protein-like 2 n=1 Tax=Geodia barretti TaxID=519541 RepID=A0AA35RNH4_GEOBA|nr:Gamma-aminobutyric acid receptor-associated protein-like 2 [Geodia barretti]
MKWQYKEAKPFEVRAAEATRIREKHPDRVPVIVEKVNGARIADLDRNKYLVPGDLTVAQFMHVLRQRIQLGATESIFLMVNGVAPTTG